MLEVKEVPLEGVEAWLAEGWQFDGLAPPYFQRGQIVRLKRETFCSIGDECRPREAHSA